MYEKVFTYNFIGNFFFSLFFLIISILFSVKVSKNNNIKKLFNFEEYQPIVIFFLIFFLYVFLFNLTILFNYKLISYIFFLIFSLKFLLVVCIVNNNKTFFKNSLNINKKIIIIVFISLYLISILPLSDADSISIYQYLPTNIFINGLTDIDLHKNIEFTLLSNAEILLLISPILKSDNFGSQLNLFVLFFFIILNFKKHQNFSLILLSSPLIIYFISTQKLQLFFGILFLLTFIIIQNNFLKKKCELFILIFLLVFYSSAKVSYILFAVPLFVYLLYKNVKKIKYIFLYSGISFLVVYLPLLILKQYYFGNIISPFADSIFGKGLESYEAFVYSIRSSEGWIADPTNYTLYIRPFISFNLSTLSSSLGLVFLLMLVDYNLQKKTKFLPLIFISLVLVTGQILPRYYFEAFLLLAYYFQSKKIITKILIYSQVAIIFLISLVYIYFAYIKYEVYKDKNNYMNNFSYSFYNSKQHKQKKFEGNILDLSLDRHSIFLNENIYSSRYLNILNNYNNRNDQNLKEFIEKKTIKYLISNTNYSAPDCLIAQQVGKTYRKTAVRNFLLKPTKNEYKILEIKDNKCTN
jgi:hypothetical protein